jgi:hypothetical protein
VPCRHRQSPRTYHRRGGDPCRASSRRVCLLSCYQNPSHARRLVGHGDDAAIHAAPVDDRSEPAGAAVRLVAKVQGDSARAVDHQAAQIMVGPSTDAAKARFASGGILPRHEADLGGEFPS